VEFTVKQPEVLNCAVTLTIEHEGVSEIVRSYDGTHGVNAMRRHNRRAVQRKRGAAQAWRNSLIFWLRGVSFGGFWPCGPDAGRRSKAAESVPDADEEWSRGERS
jgi:hypothetical protein